MRNIYIILTLLIFFSPFITLAQFHPDSVLVPTACYNFVNDFENDNGLSGVSDLGTIGGSGTFIDAEELCLNGNNKHYQMTPNQGLDVDNGNLAANTTNGLEEYTIELLFRIDSIPTTNADGEVWIMNFFNQSGKAGIFINADGYICVNDACGTTKISPNYPDDVPTDWLNIAYSFDGDNLTVYFNGNEELTVPGGGGASNFNLANNSEYFNPASGGSSDNTAIAFITLDYIRYFDLVLDATSIESLNLAAIAGNDIEIIASDTTGCYGEEINLTASGGDRSFYVWSTGDTTESEFLTYTIFQEYDTIWVQGVAVAPCERQCFDVADTIVIAGYPLPELDIVGPLQLCEDESVTYSSAADPAGVASYEWTTNGPVSSSSGADSKDFTVTFSDDGVYDLTLALTSVYGCYDKDTIQITVANVPTTTITAGNACELQPVNVAYTGDAGDSAIFTWDFDGGTIVNENVADRDFDILWDSLGTKTIYFEIEEQNCLVSDSIVVEIFKLPTMIYSAPDSVCGPAPAIINYTGNADSTAVFTWDFDGGTNSGDDRNASVVWSTVGTKNLNLHIEQDGCISDTAFTVVVLPVPTTDLTAPANICSAETANIVYTGTASADAELVWNLGGGAITSTNIENRDFNVQWATLGTKEVNLTIAQDGCDTDTIFYIVVSKTPTATFDLPAAACMDQAVRVLYTGNANLALNSPELVFDWNWGGGTSTPVTGNQEAHDVVWSTAGDKIVTLQVTENGCTSEIFRDTIYVSQKPVITIDPIPATICLDETVTVNFTGNAGSNGVFTWDFGDATQVNITDADTNFDLEWDSTGVKTFSLTINNDGCITTETFTTEVFTPPTTALTYDAFVCQNDFTRIVYKGTGNTDPSSGTVFNWTFGGADQVIDLGNEVYDVLWENFDAANPANNINTLTLEIIQNSCTTSRSFTIEIVPKPVPEIQMPATACLNEVVTVAFSSDAAASTPYTYKFNGGTEAPTADPDVYEVSWSTTGVKNVSVTYTLGGCDSTVTKAIEIFPIPSNAITGVDEICDAEDGTFTYVGDGNPITKIIWNLPAGLSLTDLNGDSTDISIDFPATGATEVYTIEAEIRNGNCSILYTHDVTVNPSPIAVIPVPNPVCSSVPLVFDISANYLSTNTYSWNWGGGIVENNNGTGIWTVSWETAGAKEIILSVRSAEGCISKDTVNVNIGLTPEMALTVPAEVCDGTDFTITYDGDMTGITNLTWTDQAGGTFTPDGANAWTVNFADSGIKKVSFRAEGGAGCRVDTTFNINVNSVPGFDLSSDNTCTGVTVLVTFTGAFNPGVDTTWTFEDADTFEEGISRKLNDSTYSVEFPSPGTKNITLDMKGGGCGDQSLTKQVIVIDGPDYTVGSNDQVCLDGDFGISVTETAGSNTDVSITNVELIPADDGASVAIGGLFVLINGWDVGGEKQAILEITDNTGSGCVPQYDTVNYVVYNYVEFELSSNNVCINEPVTLTLTSLTPPDAVFKWYFGDANVTPIIENEVYELSWSSPDEKTVGLEISSSCNATFNDININVGDPADLTLDFDPEVCVGQPAQITYDMSLLDQNSAVSNVEIKYLNTPTDFSNDDPANGTFAPVWNSAGIKKFKLIVNNGGCMDSTEYQIQVNEFPVASFTRSDNRVCVGESVDFVFNGTLPQNSVTVWDFMEDAAADITVNTAGLDYTVVWQTPGTKTIELIVNNGVCTDTLTRTVLVDPFPDFEIDVPNNLCANAPFQVSLINNGTGTIADFQFNWDFGNASSVEDMGNQVYELTYATDSSYNISVDITNTGGCNNSLSDTITINPSPNLVYTATPITLCLEDDFNFTYTGVEGTDFTGTIQLDWVELNDGTLTTVSNTESTISWDSTGTKNIRVSISDSDGCNSILNLQVNVVTPVMSLDVPSEACMGEPFIVRYTGDANPFTDSFTWTFTNQANLTAVKIAGEQAYTITTSTMDPVIIDLEVTNAVGCKSSISDTVNMFPAPDFSMNLSDVCTLDEVQVYLGSDSVITIDPGQDGTWNTVTNTVTWTTAGMKDIALTLDNDNCIVTRNFQILVKPTPGGEITPDQACVNQPVIIEYGGVGAADIYADYDWGTSFDDAISVAQIAGREAYEVIWDTPGTYLISVIVIDNGCSDTIRMPEITVKDVPVADFNLRGTICEFTPITLFVSQPNSSYTYQWDLGSDGEILSSNADSTEITAMWTEHGDRIVSLIAGENGCETVVSKTIRVLKGPDPSFDLPFFCLDKNTNEALGTIRYTGNNSLTGATFDWDFDIDATLGESADSIPGSQDYEVKYTTAGRKIIRLTVTNAQCGSRTFIDTAYVNNLAEFDFEIANDEFCEGANALFTFTGAAEDNATFEWDFGVDSAMDVINVIAVDSLYEVVYNSIGEKKISLNIVGVNCSNSYFEQSFTVAELPESDFTLTANENCLGDVTTITFTGEANSTADWIWDFADGSPTLTGEETYEVSWPSPGEKEISLVVEDGGCISDTTFQTINVYDNSAFSLMIDTDLCVDTMGYASIDTLFLEPNATWSWEFNDANILSSDKDSTFIAFNWSTSGNKSISLYVNGDKCEDADTTVAIHIGEIIPFSISSDKQICSNDSARIVFNLPMVNDRELTWDFDNPSVINKLSNTREDYYITWNTVGIKNINVTINNKGCVRDSSFQVEVKQLPSANYQSDDFYCEGDLLSLMPEWPISAFTIVEWTYNYNGVTGSSSSPNFQLSLLDSGTIELSLRVFERGCQDIFTKTIQIRETPFALIDAPDIICLEGDAVVSFDGELLPDITYEWDFDGASEVNNLGGEQYNIGYDTGGDKTIWVISYLNGCPSDTAFHTLNVFSVDNLQVSYDTICQHQTVLVDFIEESVEAEGYTWDFGEAEVLSGSGLGPYELFYNEVGLKAVTLNINGFVCNTQQLTKEIFVEPSVLSAINIDIPDLVCRNTDISVSLDLTNEGDNPQFEWFINGSSIGNMFDSTLIKNNDIITARMISNNSCAINNSALSNEVVAKISNYKYQGNTNATPNPICIGDTATLSLDAGSYTIVDWEVSENMSDWTSLNSNNVRQKVAPVINKFYRAVIVDVNGLCRQSTTPVEVRVVPYNPIEAGEDQTIREGDSRILEATKGYDFVWRNDLSIEGDVRNSRIKVSPIVTTTYFVDGLTRDGCPDTDSVTVVVLPPIEFTNVFTPNNDGVNDFWDINRIDEYPNAEVFIYDRWGKKLFTSKGYDNPWEGKFNGELLSPGVYYFVIDLKDGYDAYTGSVTILY